MLASAKLGGMLPRQADAFLILARAELHRTWPSPELALTHARQAGHLFHLVGDARQESDALALVALLLTRLGRFEEAIENATLAVRLAESLPDGAHTAVAYHHLGLATHARDSDYARQALLRSIALAQQHCGGEAATAQPRLQLLMGELYRLEQCRQSGQPAQIDPVAFDMLQALRQILASSAEAPALTPQPGAAQLAALLPLIETGLGSFQAPGEGGPAGLALLQDRSGIALEQIRPESLRGLAAWIFTRRALERGQLTRAGECLAELLVQARLHSDQRLMQTAHHLQIALLEQQGRHDEALAAFRRLRADQLLQDRENMASRERTATLRMAWRQQSQAIAELRTSSRQFERLSLEDPLTGLANRRQVERVADTLLQRLRDEREQASPWCLVMIDIDRFKQINDRHSHVTGDEVLRTTARLLRQVLRHDDLAARLAGDEFVLILPDTDEDTGRQVIERLRGEIRRHDWRLIAAGLTVSASLGLAGARPEDSLATLMQRSDLLMYADKARHDQPPLSSSA
ncbi:MAG: hypothetical protein RL654_208 [Pseudomonadota bacterium]